jgi:hypothetical protein
MASLSGSIIYRGKGFSQCVYPQNTQRKSADFADYADFKEGPKIRIFL